MVEMNRKWRKEEKEVMERDRGEHTRTLTTEGGDDPSLQTQSKNIPGVVNGRAGTTLGLLASS
jgi:hypothetical protein